MGLKFKLHLTLKESAIRVLEAELGPREMLALYKLSPVTTTSIEDFHQVDLIKIIIVLCNQLGWSVQEDEPTGSTEVNMRNVQTKVKGESEIEEPEIVPALKNEDFSSSINIKDDSKEQHSGETISRDELMKLPVDQFLVDANAITNKVELTDSDYQRAKNQDSGELSITTEICTATKNEDFSSSIIITDDTKENQSSSTFAAGEFHFATVEPTDWGNQCEILGNDMSTSNDELEDIESSGDPSISADIDFEDMLGYYGVTQDTSDSKAELKTAHEEELINLPTGSKIGKDVDMTTALVKSEVNEPGEIITTTQNKIPNASNAVNTQKSVTSQGFWHVGSNEFGLVETIAESGVQNSTSGEEMFSCKKCDKSFINRLHLYQHSYVHLDKDELLKNKSADGTFNCPNCDKPFKRMSDLYQHGYTHLEIFNCTRCDEGFQSKALLKQHSCQNHSRDQVDIKWMDETKRDRSRCIQKTFQCSQCGKICSSKGSLRKHSYTHLSQHEKPISCSSCEKRFKMPYQLRVHEKRAHSNERFSCDKCEKTYKTLKDLKQHSSKHLSYEELPFGCAQCDKKFAVSWFLTQHEKMHTNERPYICSKCGKGFINAPRLKAHEMTHTDEKPFSCTEPGCEKSFKQQVYI